MSATRYEIRGGAYYDSVVLMQLQRALLTLPGVEDAGAVMATPANLDLLLQSDILPAMEADPRPDDLLIVVRAGKDAEAEAALGQIDVLLARRRSTGVESSFRPRSIAGAAGMLPEAKWALISVPGRYAAGVADQALDEGKHVFLYSDNVSIEEEIRLKTRARDQGLLVMGPDCGTAIINGVGLGFANRARRGNIGGVGASGTGLQAVTAGIHNAGGGITHAIGTGGRDLKEALGGMTFLAGLDALIRDPQTRVIALVSKPPAPEVAARILNAAFRAGKPVVVSFIGYSAPASRIGNLHFANSMDEAAVSAVQLANEAPDRGGSVTAMTGERRSLRGVFSGGTLAIEALRGLSALLYPISSNVPLIDSQAMDDPFQSVGHCIVDLGEDLFTQGRLHPMMDNDLRLRRIRQEAADPQTAVLLIDVVLGEGSHPDPASELAPVLKEVIEKHSVEVVAVLVGTDEDPQGYQAQREQLTGAGAVVFPTVIPAVEWIASRLATGGEYTYPPVTLADLNAPLAGINVGLESFTESLIGQGAAAVQVEWKPPAGGNEKMAGLLAKMKKPSD
jgi:FdrA protein